MFELKFTKSARIEFEKLQQQPAQEALIKQIRKALGYLQTNPKHPSLRTHVYTDIDHPWDSKDKVFEAYAQNNIPSAYRIFWCYGPGHKQMTIIEILPHP